MVRGLLSHGKAVQSLSELPTGTVLTELQCRRLKPGCNCSTVLYLPKQGPWFGAGHGFATGEWTGELLPHPSPSSVEHETMQPRGSAGKSHFWGTVIILGSGITLRIFLMSWGSAGCLRAGGGRVPRPSSSHGPGSEQGIVLHLHVQSLQLHYWITLTGRPLVSYFITWVKKTNGPVG